jgi:hypothetical protein
VKTIPLFNSDLVALVDDEDYESLIGFRWYRQNMGYAIRGSGYNKVLMHRQIMVFPENGVDHIDRNKLNNTRSNLRPANQSQNMCNSAPEHYNTKRSRTKFRGVSWDSARKRWFSYIKANGALIHLGRFDSDVEAAEVRDKAALKLHGEFASLNFQPAPL